MTEEQYKECKEIIDFKLLCEAHRKVEGLNGIINTMTISLAKVFNKDITKKEAKGIFDNILKKNCVSSYPPNNYFFTFWGIANYFDDGTTDGMTLNYLRDKNFKEIKKDNENNKENNK